jgi:FdrA protein
VVEELRAKLDGCQRFLRALFSGGTLCYEAQSIWKELLSSPVYSNAPLSKENKLPDSNRSQGHSAIDLGEEEFTRGRPHPMIDNSLRIQRLRQEAFDPHTAVIVLDVVLGYGAHADPAGELGTAIEQISSELRQNERTVVFIASVTGTQADPQNLQQSTQKLADSGVLVCSSNAQAARLAARFVEGRR